MTNATKELVKTLREQAMMDNEEYYDKDYRKLSADAIEQLQSRNAELFAELESVKHVANDRAQRVQELEEAINKNK